MTARHKACRGRPFIATAMILGLTATLLGLTAAFPALGRPAPNEPSEQAQQAVALGQDAMGNGDWQGALRSFGVALEASPQEPQALLGMGQAQAQAGHELSADGWLRAYLAAAPEAEDRPLIREKIAQLEDSAQRKAGQILDVAVSGAEKIFSLYGTHWGYYYPDGYCRPIDYTNGHPVGEVPGSSAYIGAMMRILKAVARHGDVERAAGLLASWGDLAPPHPTDSARWKAAENLPNLWMAYGDSRREAGDLDGALAAYNHSIGGKAAWFQAHWLGWDAALFDSAIEIGACRWAAHAAPIFRFNRGDDYAQKKENEALAAADSQAEHVKEQCDSLRSEIISDWVALAREAGERESTDIRASIERVTSESPHVGRAAGGFADLADRRYTSALNQIHRLARKAELVADAVCRLADDASYAQGHSAEAISLCNCAIAIAPDSGYAYYYRAEAESRLGDWGGAIADYGRGLAVNPDDPDCYTRRAWLKYKLGDSEGALADFGRACELTGDKLGLKEKAAIEAREGNDEAAIADFSTLIGNAPHPGESWLFSLWRGVAEQAKGDDESAILDYDRSVSDESASSARFLRILLARRLGREVEPLPMPPDSSQAWPSDVTRFFRGELSERAFLKRAAASEDQFSGRAWRLADAYCYAGMMRVASGDISGGRALLARCLADFPGDRDPSFIFDPADVLAASEFARLPAEAGGPIDRFRDWIRDKLKSR